jgi:lambda family phage portal protein
MAQAFWVAMRHYLIDGDALAVVLWRDKYVEQGLADYATSIQLIDPDRLSNPQYRFDTQTQRGGVEVDEDGGPLGYWIRRAHQGDWFSAAASMTWDYFPKQTAWGRPVVIHAFEHERAAQHHGGVGVLTAVLQRLKMLVRYDTAELEAAIINAIFSAYVKSPYDPEMMREAMEAKDIVAAPLGLYQDGRNDFWQERGKMFVGGAQVTQLFPGEEIGQVAAARPAGEFEPFEVAVLRHIASGIGCTYEQLTGDFSRTNYSSFRGATNEALKTYNRRAKNFEAGIAMQVRGAIMEEIFDREELPLPNGAPEFMEARLAYSACMWLRPGRGWVNPLDELRAASLAVQSGLSTMEIEAAEQGRDVDDMIDQRKIEIEKFKAAGIELPPIYQGPASQPDNVTAPGGNIGSGG